MADEIFEQLRRYWFVIVTVAVLAFGLGSANAIMLYRLNDMASALANLAAEGPRYTLKDHLTFAERQGIIDAAQERRLTILEQVVKP